jgi:hypothetical protein
VKQTKTVTVFCKKSFEPGFMPTNALNAFAWLRGVIDTIPDEYRDTARIEVDSGSEYDVSFASLTISYERPETDAEETMREQERAAYRNRERQRLMLQLARLDAAPNKD